MVLLGKSGSWTIEEQKCNKKDNIYSIKTFIVFILLLKEFPSTKISKKT